MDAIVRRVMVAAAVLLMAGPVWAQGTPPSGLQGFSIVLVLGDMQDGAPSDSVPAAARAALADLKDFLPYRGYRVLDTAWLLASSTNRQAVTSRLRGSDEQEYEVVLDRIPVGPSSLQIGFVMREPSGDIGQKVDAAHREAALKSELMQMMAARGALESQLRQQASDPNAVAALRARLAEAELAIETRQNQLRSPGGVGGATLIDTSFTMSLGETVVVGTSRMRGGSKALIVLLTAATRGAKPRE